MRTNRIGWPILIIVAVAVFCILAAMQGCGNAESNDISATIIPGPSGVTCYAIMQGGEVKAGNCR